MLKLMAGSPLAHFPRVGVASARVKGFPPQYKQQEEQSSMNKKHADYTNKTKGQYVDKNVTLASLFPTAMDYFKIKSQEREGTTCKTLHLPLRVGST